MDPREATVDAVYQGIARLGDRRMSVSKARRLAEEIVATGLEDASRPDGMTARSVACRRVVRTAAAPHALAKALRAVMEVTGAGVARRRGTPAQILVRTNQLIRTRTRSNVEDADALVDLGTATGLLLGELGSSPADKDLSHLAVQAYERAANAVLAAAEPTRGRYSPSLVSDFMKRLRTELQLVAGAEAPVVMDRFAAHVAREAASGPRRVLADALRTVAEPAVGTEPAASDVRDAAAASVQHERLDLHHDDVWTWHLTAVLEDRRTHQAGPPALSDYIEQVGAFDRHLDRKERERAQSDDVELTLRHLAGIVGPMLRLRGAERHPSTLQEMVDAQPPANRPRIVESRDPRAWANLYAAAASRRNTSGGRPIGQHPDYQIGLKTSRALERAEEICQTWRSRLPKEATPHLAEAQRRLRRALDTTYTFAPSQEEKRLGEALGTLHTVTTWIDDVQSTARNVALGRAAGGQVPPGAAEAVWEQVELSIAASTVPAGYRNALPFSASDLRTMTESGGGHDAEYADEQIALQFLVSTAGSRSLKHRHWRLLAERVTGLLGGDRTNEHAQTALVGTRRPSRDALSEILKRSVAQDPASPSSRTRLPETGRGRDSSEGLGAKPGVGPIAFDE